MPEYIYIASNPSMPGLIKLGETTTSPSKRLKELHSTGVPTPFVLEISFEVDDGRKSETLAHATLWKYRVAGNREFFRVPVATAIKEILSVIGEHKIHVAKSAYGIESIKKEIQQKKLKREQEKEKRAKINAERRKREKAKREEKRIHLRNILIAKIKSHEREIDRLGLRPVRKELSKLENIFVLAYEPFPVGCVAWAFMPCIFFSEARMYGVVATVLILIGYAFYKKGEKYDSEYAKLNKPFEDVDKKIAELNGQLGKLEKDYTIIEMV